MLGKKFILLLICAFVSACTSNSIDSYFTTGAGLSLHTPDTPKATTDIQKYYRALCLQANPFADSGTPSSIQCGSIKELVNTGFNDIDSRCDRYLAWIDQRRIAAGTFPATVSATNTLAAGLINSGNTAIRDISLILGFATSVYDSYNNALLNGIESSTIKKLVYERQRAYRSAFANAQYDSFSDATYALRSYLRICTPQTIVLSANEYTIAGLTGVDVMSPAEQAQRDAAILGPVSSTAPANTTPDRGSLNPCPTCNNVFGPGFVKFAQPGDIRALQVSMCFTNVTGNAPANGLTVKALRRYDSLYGKKNKTDGKVTDRDEWASILANGCKPDDISQTGFRSPYERLKFTNSLGFNEVAVKELYSDISNALNLTGNDALKFSQDEGLGSSKFRNTVKNLRAEAIKKNVLPAEANLYRDDVLTLELVNALENF